MILLATYFFKKDTEIRITETSMKIADTVGSKTKSDFSAIVEKIQLLVFSMRQDIKKTGNSEEIHSILLNNDKDLFMVGIYSKEEEKFRAVSSPIYNEKLLQSFQLTSFDMDKIIETNQRRLSESFTGKPLVSNTSKLIEVPTFTVSYPIDKESGFIVISIIHTNKIKEAFLTKEGITETFLVNDRGEVIAHPNEKFILSEKNLYEELPIVSAMLTSKLDNGQLTYIDKFNEQYYIGAYKKVGFSGLGVVTTVPQEKAFEEVYRIQKRNLIIMGVSLCLAFFIVYNFSKTITTPLLKLVLATKEIEKGNFHVPIQPSSQDEVGLLTTSFVEMGKGLEERDKVKNILGSMVDPVVVKEAMNDLAALKKGSEKEITAFFSDVASFSTISEKLSSIDLAAVLNEYLSAMTIILKEHKGVLDKYIGDAIVGIFNAPVDVESHALQAARASIKMLQKLKEIRAYWIKHNYYIPEAHAMDIRIGLNTGLAKVGFMGTDDLASYTMMGDTVNLAARLEAAGKDYGVNILISENTKNKIEQEMYTRFLDLVRVKGKNEPVKIYELISPKTDVPNHIVEATEIYNQAFQLYLNQDWLKAIDKFSQVVLISQKNDKAAELLIDRCVYYNNSNPGKNWDGVFTRKTK
jgi:adenylate cyclase